MKFYYRIESTQITTVIISVDADNEIQAYARARVGSVKHRLESEHVSLIDRWDHNLETVVPVEYGIAPKVE